MSLFVSFHYAIHVTVPPTTIPKKVAFWKSMRVLWNIITDKIHIITATNDDVGVRETRHDGSLLKCNASGTRIEMDVEEFVDYEHKVEPQTNYLQRPDIMFQYELSFCCGIVFQLTNLYKYFLGGKCLQL